MSARSLIAATAVLAWLTAGAAAQRPASGGVTFDEVSRAVGIDFTHANGATPERHLREIMSGGGLFLDYDDDGWIDVFLVDGGPSGGRTAAKPAHRLFRNRGMGTFEDVTATAGLAHRAYGMGGCAADYDNDGWIDLYLTNDGPNALYRNIDGKRFLDVTDTARVGSAPAFSASCAFADIDQDGRVDLFVVNYVDARPDNNIFCGDRSKQLRIYCHPLNFAPLSDVLYRNNGDGTFTDITQKAGLAGGGNGLGAVFGDYDDDGLVDLFVANDTTPNFLYHNEGGGRFTELALPAGVAVASDGRTRAGMGTDFGDYDGDGRLDIIVTNHELEAHTLFRNLGDGLFEDATSRSGVGLATLPFVGFGAVFFDHDRDTDLDLAIVNGHVMNSPEHFRPGATEAQRKLLLENDGAGRFTEVGRTSGAGFASANVGRALAAGDIDNDGDLDLLVVNNGGPAELLRSGGARERNAILVRLVGTRSNRSAIGATIRLTADGRTQVRTVTAGSSYLSQHDLRAHFGLGSAGAADRIEIRWPSGARESLSNVGANQIVTVVEGKGVTRQTRMTAR